MKASRILQAVIFLVILLTATFCVAQSAGPRVLILVTSTDKEADGKPTGLWLEEYTVPYNVLVKAGAKITVVSPKGGETPIDPHSKAKPEQEAAWKDAMNVLHTTGKLSASIRVADYDAIFIPGGHGPLFDLATDPQVAKLVSSFARAGKPVASVCHGPAALVGATLADGTPFVKGKKLTAFSDAEEKAAALYKVPFSVQQKLAALGASYSQGPNFTSYTVVDGKLITGQNPPSSQKVAELLVEQLKGQKAPAKSK